MQAARDKAAAKLLAAQASVQDLAVRKAEADNTKNVLAMLTTTMQQIQQQVVQQAAPRNPQE